MILVADFRISKYLFFRAVHNHHNNSILTTEKITAPVRVYLDGKGVQASIKTDGRYDLPSVSKLPELKRSKERIFFKHKHTFITVD